MDEFVDPLAGPDSRQLCLTCRMKERKRFSSAALSSVEKRKGTRERSCERCTSSLRRLAAGTLALEGWVTYDTKHCIKVNRTRYKRMCDGQG